ncbi:FAD binding domain-containing protein [Coniella lustricola]|uniref:FAD binding domain-containing protein n=1 Tax=Coniella lustricola TaxID=2025994 RepID=A0A2T3A6P4_9PEZI|nr:FAD binding domain-containing protein [Coniella lustricola]
MIAFSAFTLLQSCLNNTLFTSFFWVKPYNLAVDVTPAAVIRPESTEEVAAIVQCAVKTGFKVQARSGGHSYANFGLGNGASTVDLVNFQNYNINESSWHANIGPGMNLGNLDQHLHKTGRALPHGLCPGGGLGPTSRMWGALLDHIVEVEMVIANGSIIRAREDLNQHMFYAIRGAGASFGIVTEFVMDTEPEPGSVIQYTFDLSRSNAQDSHASVYMQWQDLIGDPDLDRRFGTQLLFSALGTIMTGSFFGTEAEWIASGIPACLPANGTTIITDWLASLVNWAEQEALYLTSTPVHFYSKSLGFRQQDMLSNQSASQQFKDLAAQPKDTPLWFIVFDAEGGAVNDVATNTTAYAHRDNIMFYQSYVVDALRMSKTSRDFATDFHNDLVALLPSNDTGRGTYPGYVGLDISGVPQERYWESNLPHLTALKSLWDPHDIFHNPQSIRPLSE